MRNSKLIVIVGLVALVAAACGSSSSSTSTHAKSTSTSSTSSSSSAAGKVTIATRTVKPYGTVLVNSAGHTLYVFAPDKATKVTCTGGCATIWPPVKLASGAKAVASGQVKASLLGSDSNPGGGSVATYNHWPLYAYVTDTSAGVAHGEGINSSGGLWYVISPSGKVIKSKTSSSSSSGPSY